MTSQSELPCLLKVARGERVSRPPVWLMRQAGRYMKEYRALRDQYPSFRQRSENPDLAIEISLQPWRAFQPDGVILFSDILTPLPGMGIDFDIVENKGPVIDPPIRTQAQVDAMHPLDPERSLPFIKTILKTLREEVGNQSTVLGFVGAPWTLAAYAIEGKTSKNYSNIKGMAFNEPQLLHQFLSKVADAIAIYVRYQIDSGAQVVRVVEQVKQTHPETPLILYISGSAGVLERMGRTGFDIISLDWTVDLAEARQRLGQDTKVQGNVDPGVLFGSKEFIRDRVLETIRKGENRGHILNLGHGVLPGTPEDNVRHFFEVAKSASN